VEVVPARLVLGTAALPAPVRAQLADHQLAHGVVEIGRVVCAARRLLLGVARVLVALLDEHAPRLGQRHALGVQSDGREQAHVAQQRLRQLSDVDSGIAIAQALVPHHLLAVVRPAFCERVADVELAHHRWRAIGFEEMQEMPGPDFVHGNEQQLGFAGYVGQLLGLRP